MIGGVRPLLIAATAALLAAGCAGADETCAELVDRVEACYGAAAAESFGETATCEPEDAAWATSLSCDELAKSIAGGKADDAIDEAVAAAIREGLRAALTQAFDVVWETLAGTGIDRDAVAPFLLLSRHDTWEEASLKRNELSQLLDPPELSPVVVRSGDGYDVIHSACPIDAPALIADQISAAIVGSPSFLPAIGSELVVTPTETGQTIQFPLQLVLFDADVAAEFGCER